ncbi:MAG: CPBP family intramembrane glutamic endopeptidase [Anditalea sp.]
MNKVTLSLALGTLFFFGIGGIFIIEYLQDQSFIDVLMRGWDIPFQLIIGLLAGMAASGIAMFIITRKFFKQEKKFYYNLISKLDLNLAGILILSLCAGIGEELFFRAGIQPLLGIWWTSFLFVMLHGYLNPKNLRISIYGLVMVAIIAGFGYLFKYSGIFTAMTAHAVFDMVLLLNMTKKRIKDQSAS